MPTITEPEPIDEARQNLVQVIHDLPPNPNKSLLKPSTWEQRLSEAHAIKDYSGVSKIINQSTVILDEASIIDILNANQDLSILTIASGNKGEFLVIHNVFQSDGKLYGLVGSTDQGNLTELLPSRLFNNNSRGGDGSSFVPSTVNISDHLKSLKEGETIKSLDEVLEMSEQLILKNSLIITPPQTQIVLSCEDPNISTLETTVLNAILTKDKQEMMEWSIEREKVNELGEEEDPESSPTLSDDTFQHPSLNENVILLQNLNGWSSAGKKEAGARVSQNRVASVIQKRLNNSLCTAKSPPPPNGLGNHLNFTGGALEVTPPRNRTSFQVESEDNHIQSPFTQDSLTIPPTNSNNDNVMARLLLQISQSIETVQNNNASSNKKCSKLIEQMILNLSTTDGINPAPVLQQFALDITRAKVSEADFLTDNQLHKEGVVLMTNPCISKSLSTGQLASLDSSNGFSSLHMFPISFKELEHQDAIHNLVEWGENGQQLNEQERSKINSNAINPAKSISCLELKLKGMKAIAKGYCGPDSIAFYFFSNLVTWAETNKATLELRQKSHDNVLAARIESHYTDVFNQYLLSSRHGVPDESILDTSFSSWGLLNGTVKPDLSQQISDALNGGNKNKKRKRNESNGGAQNNNKAKKGRDTYTPVRNKNQVKELTVSNDKFKEVIHPNRNDAPSHNGTQECLKFHFKGICNEECALAATHNKPAGKRLTNLKEFLKSAEEKNKKEEPKE